MADLENVVRDYLDRQVDRYVKPCFDSSIFLAKINEEICQRVKRNIVFDWIWDKAKNNEFEVFISPITLAEVHKIKRRTNGASKTPKPHTIEVFHELIEEKFVKVIEISRRTGLRAGELCRELQITPNDALILASAIEARCDTLLAWDVSLIGKKHDAIRIEEPFIYKRDLFHRTIEIATDEEQKEYDRLERERKEKERNAKTAKSVKSDVRGGVGESTESPASRQNGKAPNPQTGKQETSVNKE